MKNPEADFAAAAELLAAHPDYRLLRRIQPVTTWDTALTPADPWMAIVDTETTGLGPDRKIIEIGIKMVWIKPTGDLRGATRAVSFLEDPGEPLSAEVRRVTGLTDDDLRGHRFPDGEIDAFIAGAEMVVAHNAAFDRPAFDRRFPTLAGKRWACSMAEIDWKRMGCPSASLAVISWWLGGFYDAHRAAADVEALTWILFIAAERDPFIRRLFENTRQTWRRVWAMGAPFEMKDALKARGYRWNDTSKGVARCWFIDTRNDDEYRSERQFLEKYRINPRVDEIYADRRYAE